MLQIPLVSVLLCKMIPVVNHTGQYHWLNITATLHLQTLQAGEPQGENKERMMPPKDSVDKMKRFNEVNSCRLSEHKKRHPQQDAHAGQI